MSKEIAEYKSNDEIDLVDILVVILKRKWIIIGLVLAALVLSGIYVALFSKTSYKAEITINPPRGYKIEQNGLLGTKNAKMDSFLSTIKNELSSQKEIKTMVTSDKVNITGQKENIAEAILALYQLLMNFENKVEGKNSEILNVTQNSLEKALIQKNGMVKNLTIMLNRETLAKLPAGSENAILYMINTLSSDIIEIEIIKGLNEELELSKGSFVLAGSESGEIVLNQKNIDNLRSFITPEKSKKRQLLPVIISVFLALFVGVFLAFVIEFFSKEDVKRRLRKIKRPQDKTIF